MDHINCPKCFHTQWSITDQNYVKLFNICWSCDKENWMNGNLSLKEFENREKQASTSKLGN